MAVGGSPFTVKIASGRRTPATTMAVKLLIHIGGVDHVADQIGAERGAGGAIAISAKAIA